MILIFHMLLFLSIDLINHFTSKKRTKKGTLFCIALKIILQAVATSCSDEVEMVVLNAC